MQWFRSLSFKICSFNITLIAAWRENDSIEYCADDKALIRFFLISLSGCIWFLEKFSRISDSQTIALPIMILCFPFLNLISCNKAIFQGIEIFYNEEKYMLCYFFTKSFTYKWAPPLILVYCLHSEYICIFNYVFQTIY